MTSAEYTAQLAALKEANAHMPEMYTLALEVAVAVVGEALAAEREKEEQEVKTTRWVLRGLVGLSLYNRQNARVISPACAIDLSKKNAKNVSALFRAYGTDLALVKRLGRVRYKSCLSCGYFQRGV